MKIQKAVFAIFAIGMFVLFATSNIAHAGADLEFWPTEPGVRGAIHKDATLAATQSGCYATLILSTKTINGNTLFFYTETLEIDPCAPFPNYIGAVSTFLNRPEVVNGILDCPADEDCSNETYVHIKRVDNDSSVVNDDVLPVVYSLIGDLELVLNDEPPVFE